MISTKLSNIEHKKLVKLAKKNSSFKDRKIYDSQKDQAGMNYLGKVYHFSNLRRMLP